MAESRPADADGVFDTRDDGRHVLRFERRLDHPIDRVWAALTTPEQLLRWWGSADELDLVRGGRVVLRWLNKDAEGNQVVLHGTVTRFEPPTLLEYDTDVHGVLRFDLRADGAATVLRFSATVDFPLDAVPMCMAGWHLHLDYLAATLDGESTDLVDLPMARWQHWHDGYQAKLG